MHDIENQVQCKQRARRHKERVQCHLANMSCALNSGRTHNELGLQVNDGEETFSLSFLIILACSLLVRALEEQEMRTYASASMRALYFRHKFELY